MLEELQYEGYCRQRGEHPRGAPSQEAFMATLLAMSQGEFVAALARRQQRRAVAEDAATDCQQLPVRANFYRSAAPDRLAPLWMLLDDWALYPPTSSLSGAQ
jgi:hypothetical protein